MDYAAGTISLYTADIELSEDDKTSECEIETWISENTEHKFSDIYYMTSKNEIEILEF